MNEALHLTAEQLAYARAIRLVEMNLEPKCEGCGYGADRPNCFNGGGCSRHEQEDVIAFKRVRDSLTKLGGLRDIYGWRYKVPLDQLYDFTEKEKALLLDLHDRGGKQSTRKMDERFDTLGCGNGIAKGAVMLSACGGRWHVEMTDRAHELVARWLAREPADA
jgi:hypothetical protein